MTAEFSLERALIGVKIYCDQDALDVDPGTHKANGIKSFHDELHQAALDMKLATAVALVSSVTLGNLREQATVVAHRPSWYPANRSLKMRHDLLLLDAKAFGKSWLKLRLVAEPPSRQGSLWDDDPALIFSPTPSVLLCRTASVGHEGYIHYFVYGREQAWEDKLTARRLSLFGCGADAYRRLIPEPGSIAG